MKRGMRTVAAVMSGFVVLTAIPAAAAEMVVEKVSSKPRVMNTTVNSVTDSAFAADLKAAEDLLKGLSRERKMTVVQRGEYVAKEMERARKFFAFAKDTLTPHGLAIMKMMNNPDGMLAEGRGMVEADPSSWRGYDYQASGSMLKKDMDGAMVNFEKALAFAPEFQKDWYRYMMGACLTMKKDEGKALEYYEGVITRNENWLAVKGSYLAASMTLLGKNDAKASAYFEKGFSLHSREEQGVILKTGVCDKFRGLEKGPEVCVAQNKM